MKKSFILMAMAAFLISRAAFAVSVADYPEKGWHKGPYLAATVGMMQVTNDKHSQTDLKYDGTFDPAYGLVFGWDVADWIGPMLQVNFGTTTSDVGIAGNATYPLQSARQYAVDFSILAKATLPYFTHATWQKKNFKILPYAKLGGTGSVMYVNASESNNKIGAFGGGPAVGLGVEFLVWKGLFLTLDTTEHLIIQKSYYRTINGSYLKVTDGGFKPHFSFAGMFGWHF